MGARKRTAIISTAHTAEFPSLEFHLVRAGKFFARENIFTTFPECRDFVDDLDSKEVSVYLLCTFQSNDGELVNATAEELQCEREAMEIGLYGTAAAESPRPHAVGAARSDTQFSSLISYAPESVMWKDRSREVFFRFMTRVRQVIGDTFNGQLGRVFLDWPDPASGLPIHTHRGSSILVESDVVDQYFSFPSTVIAGAGGGCRIIDHPVYGWNTYPASAVLAIATEDEPLLRDALLSIL